MRNQSFNHNGREHNGHRQEMMEIVTVQEFPQILKSQSRKWHPRSWGRRQIHRVPPQLRLRRQKKGHVYNPQMVSLGPYHHGKPELEQAEEFKHHCLDWCADGDEEKKIFFYNKILEIIDVIRDCYADAAILKKYDDNALAKMMFLDACFIINYINNCAEMESSNLSDWFDRLGMAATVRFIARDIMVLENQIPLRVITTLTSLMYEEKEAEELLEKFLSWITFVDLIQAKLTREYEEPPIHLLEACWRVLVNEHNIKPSYQFRWPSFLARRKKTDKNEVAYTCRSVMDLKAKGIHFKPSSSHYLKDITFKSHAFYGQLQLPVRYVSERTHVILSNMIAYEVSPNSKVRPVVLSYTNFMKALIESPADAKELQEKGILLNRFVNHEQVVKMFKEIDTFGLLDLDTFTIVKHSIEEHCSSKAKTWMADLIHTRFQTPWTAIAFFAAAFLLCLTFLQTFFTIRPVK